MTPYHLRVGESEITLSPSDVQNLDIVQTGKHSYHINENNTNYQVEVDHIDGKNVLITIDGSPFQIVVEDHYDQLIKDMGLNAAVGNKLSEIKSPMPGLIIDILVQEGDAIEKNTPLLVLEAMKMENILKSEGDGIIESINISKGDAVEKSQILINLQ